MIADIAGDETSCGACVLVRCHAIHMLPGWQDSRGAQLEHHIATELGMPATYPADDRTPNTPEGSGVPQ